MTLDEPQHGPAAPCREDTPMKTCARCGKPIAGEAMLLDDCSASGASAPAYWHTDPADCRRPALPPASAGVIWQPRQR